MEELVFAIPTDILWKKLVYNAKGLIKENGDVLDRIIRNGLFRKRSELEEDPSFKQLIPYGIITAQESVYLFTRTSGQTEARLHHKLHLGVGGHMNPSPSPVRGKSYAVSELKREFFEEVNLLKDCIIENIEFKGFINDDSIEVGRFHLGLLYHIRVSNQHMAINETGKMSARWIARTDLADYYEELESWSRMTIDHIV